MQRKYPRPIFETRTEQVLVAWEHRCAYCNRVFRSKLRRAKYCPQTSGRLCRLKAYRERR